MALSNLFFFSRTVSVVRNTVSICIHSPFSDENAGVFSEGHPPLKTRACSETRSPGGVCPDEFVSLELELTVLGCYWPLAPHTPGLPRFASDGARCRRRRAGHRGAPCCAPSPLARPRPRRLSRW